MIASFGDQATADLFHNRPTRRVRQFPHTIQPIALRKLDMIDMAHQLVDLRSPPGNRLEALKGTLRGFHSIRVNNQWRVVFRWSAGTAYDVRLTDYH